jgi:hypothetical protein
MLRRTFLASAAMAAVAATTRKAHALTEELHHPRINFPKDYSQRTADAVHKVLRDDSFKFVNGSISYWPPEWSTTLVYDGNTRLLNGFLDDLRKIQGMKVRVSFSKDLGKEGGSLHRGASWWVKYKQTTPETIVVRVNLAAKEIDAEKLDLQLDKSPKEEPDQQALDRLYK